METAVRGVANVMGEWQDAGADVVEAERARMQEMRQKLGGRRAGAGVWGAVGAVRGSRILLWSKGRHISKNLLRQSLCVYDLIGTQVSRNPVPSFCRFFLIAWPKTT